MNAAAYATTNRTARRPDPRRRGVVAVLAMMFLMIFGSLAAAMAIVSQGNLRTADSQLKINRSMAAAETGMDLMVYRLQQVTQGDPDDLVTYPGVYTTDGLIVGGATGNAYGLWAGVGSKPGVAEKMVDAMAGDVHWVDNSDKAYIDSSTLGTDVHGRAIHQLVIPEVWLTKNGSGRGIVFSATMTPHALPLALQPSSLGYDDPFYDRLPYGPPGDTPGTAQYDIDMAIKEAAGIDYIVSETVGTNATYGLETRPLDGTFIRVKVTAYDGGGLDDPRFDPDSDNYDPELVSRRRIYRSISMDFRMNKTVPYAVLSRSRVMIGRNVLIKGNVGSRFTETDKLNGHPIQVMSDFIGLSDDLDAQISPPSAAYPAGGTFHNELVTNDIDGDNRLNIANATEVKDLPGDPATYDHDGDGYVTEFDYFLAEFDTDNIDGKVSLSEFLGGVDSDVQATAQQLFDLMDQGNAYTGPDGFIDGDDLYAKIRGQVSTKATVADWNTGLGSWADNGTTTTPDYKDYLQGLVKPDYGAAALTTADPALDVHVFDQHSFDTKSFADMADGDTIDGVNDAGSARVGETEAFDANGSPLEPVPFEAEYPYDYYDRAVYTNKVFTDARIKVGANSVFENCLFQGVTYIEVEPNNDDVHFNYVGMVESDGTPKHPDYFAGVNGATVPDTKPFGNNIRFHGCRFEGPVVSGAPDGSQPASFTHVRNKVTFTGDTVFDFEAEPDEDLQTLYKRSSLLLPHVSVEMGSFADGNASDQNLELTGAVVAGLIDMRGKITINGTLITTYEPVSGEAPVLGDTAPQFNTTLGYFSEGQGDLEAKIPDTGLGKIRISYDPTIALPDGIDGPIELAPLTQTYHEGGK